MSTPPGKPLNPIDLFNHVSHKAREGAVTEPAGSPYAPKRAHQRLREHTARYAVGSHDVVHPNIGRHEQLAAEHRAESMSDRDLEQLEASLRVLRGIVVAIILVATIGYYFAVGGWAPSSEPASGPQTASDPTVASPQSWSMGQQARAPTMAQDDNRATSAQTSQSIKTSQPARSSEGETGAIVQPDEPGAQIPPASKATRVLDPDEITLLMKQGEQFIAAGDVVTARIVFQRAAEAGDANAAMALGATYDPTVLAKLGVAGLGADLEKARTWYQKAESLGSTEATRRLAILENR